MRELPSKGVAVVLAPSFPARSIALELIERYMWYLSPLADDLDSVVLHINNPVPEIGHIAFSSAQIDQISASAAMKNKVLFSNRSPDDVISYYLEETAFKVIVLLWQDDLSEVRRLASRSSTRIRVVRSDFEKVRFASSYLLKLPSLINLHNLRTQNWEIFFERMSKYEIFNCFGTGESLDAASYTIDYSGSASIACNSMVKSPDMLKRLNTIVIVCADPVYHAGPSLYARQFRKDVERYLLDNEDVWLIIPKRDEHIYLHYFHHSLSNRILSLSFDTEARLPNLNLVEKQEVTTTENILTLISLPLAATFGKLIRIIGCDGRPRTIKNEFWRHSSEHQYDYLMKDLRTTHPGFFDIDFDGYYEKHCETVNAWLVAIEEKGVLVESLTPSLIPALAIRYKGH